MSWVGQKAVSTLWPPRMNSGTGSRVAQLLPAVRLSMIPTTFKQLNQLDRAFARLARRAPIVLRCIATCLRSVAKHAGGVLLRASVRGQPSDEAKAVDEQGRWFPKVMAEGTANPRGVVDEYLAIAAPWGFLPEDVTTPVRIYQGTADTLVPEEWGQLLDEADTKCIPRPVPR